MFSPLVPIPYYHHVEVLPQADDLVSSREVRYSDKENKRFLNKLHFCVRRHNKITPIHLVVLTQF